MNLKNIKPRSVGLRRREAALAVMALAATASTTTVLAHGDAHGDAHGAKAKSPALPPEQKDWGIAGTPSKKLKTIELRMSDEMRFTPDRIEVTEGDTLRLVAKNTGKVLHEIVIGTTEELEAHAALMKRFPNMQHDEPYMAHVPPGKRGEIIWTFNRPGEFAFACLIAGHYEAGMRGTILVKPRKG